MASAVRDGGCGVRYPGVLTQCTWTPTTYLFKDLYKELLIGTLKRKVLKGPGSLLRL